jgi:hypothetical protein
MKVHDGFERMRLRGALKKGETGTLRVAATPMVIENTLSPFLGPYRRRYPSVEVQLVEEGGIAIRPTACRQSKRRCIFFRRLVTIYQELMWRAEAAATGATATPTQRGRSLMGKAAAQGCRSRS